MNQPIIYLNEVFNEEQLEQVKAVAPNYLVKTSTDHLSSAEEEAIEIMLGWHKEIGPRLLASDTSQLKWIQLISAGADYMDFDKLREKGILLSNGSGIHSVSISEHVLGVLLAHTRGLQESIQQQMQHTWNQTAPSYQQLSGQKMLIVGTGQIGQQLAKFAKGLNLQVYGVNTSGHVTEGFIECYSQKNMSKIIHEMSIVVNILPLTETTKHLYNQALFEKMAPETIFVNVGRGASVATNDLITALNNKTIAFAALDVFEEEPLPEDSPLWEMQNVLLTPHISGMTPKFKSKLLAIFIPNLNQFVTDQTLVKNQVSLKKGY
ncbi:phosphoglycerate dehydrogenase [Enterococcus faecalis]|jgi:phosphoglycerate dehydrogenase-like enzyme|uniref:phosphoglycerate dehydrogenase n=1 Tax=Enterococcus TaxID=1350 RepID=UPI000C314A5F|nr:phosphoglycerate dehydrogenase [Enterococcus faecalis]EGO8372047.1 hydroxyacid dehydrogenase [Enterococcus faecalis]EGO8756811.1 hydroxyacid dehydrogenase [Enterococcus faecalis]EGO8833476.1 hydroxyacid dehydrogenase [Enterococcus faecalis]EGO9019310.1 hydroxyacid dehydrogenase [Enterococcus faecalis]EGO9059348.1 hydroxyacid dehydrogenase [Enterococcus faecalis]